MRDAKPGQSVFLRVGSEFGDPVWRQGLVVKRHSSARMLIMVRAMEHGMKTEEGEVTLYSLEHRKFMLVEGSAGQLKELPPDEPFSSLEVKPTVLLKFGKEWVATATSAGTEIHTATASEDPEAPEAPRKQVRAVPSSSSSEEVSEGADEDDEDEDADLLKLLQAAQKKQPASGGKGDSSRKAPKGEKKKSRERFPLLKASNSEATGSADLDMASVMTKMLQSNAGGKPDLQTLQTMLMMKMLSDGPQRKRSERRSRRTAQEESDSQDDSSSGDDKKLRGAARAFNRYRKSKEAMWEKPMKHVRIYIREVETELGVEHSDMPYNLWDYTRKIPFGKQKGLFRCHYLVSHILKHLLDDDKQSAALMTVLTLRCLHQVALDSGNWEVGWMLTTLKDPLSRRRWGGEPGHLESATDYLRAVQELEKRTKQASWWSGEQNETETPETNKVWKPPKGTGKGKDKDKGDKPPNPAKD